MCNSASRKFPFLRSKPSKFFMNRIMDNLDKNQFIVMLDTLLNRRLSDAECTAFHASYKEFIDLLHELARLQSRLMRLQERIVEKESPQASLLKSAHSVDEFRNPIGLYPACYPSIAAPVSVEVSKSPLFLSEQYHGTDNGSASLRSHTPHRRYTGRSGDTCRCAFRNFQRPYQQSGTVPLCRRQPQAASDPFSGFPAQQSDRLQPAIAGMPN